MNGVDEVICWWPFRVSEVLRKRLNCVRCPFLDVFLDKGLNELVSPLRTIDVQRALLEHSQRWELSELGEGRKAIELGVVEFSVQSLDLAIAPYARMFDFHTLTMGVDPGEICLYLGQKDLEVYGYNSALLPPGSMFNSPLRVIFSKSRSFSRRNRTIVGVSRTSFLLRPWAAAKSSSLPANLRARCGNIVGREAYCVWLCLVVIPCNPVRFHFHLHSSRHP